MTIRELHQQVERQHRVWRSRPNGIAGLRAAQAAFRDQAAELRQRLPLATSVAYAYNPNQSAGSNGRDHLILREELAAGRLKRKAGDALCKPAKRFWGLEELTWDQKELAGVPTCLRCLEIAERLAGGGK